MSPPASAACAAINSMPNVSHYDLVVDTDACVKCGMCAQQCPPYAITMGETGPEVDHKYTRCGQCGTVCPVGARKLVKKDEFPELPEDMLQGYSLKASYHFAHDMVH